MIDALITGGASLLGGLFGSNSQKKQNAAQRRWQEKVTDPAYIRRRYENAGVNPMLGLGGPTPQTSPAPVGSIVADSIASAGMIYTDEVQRNEQQAVQTAKLEMENERLRQNAQRLALMGEIAGPSIPRRPNNPNPSIVQPNVNATDPAQPTFNAANGAQPFNQTLNEAIDADHIRRSTSHEQISKPLYQTFTDKDGETTAVPVGPGLDEAATGLALEFAPQLRQWWDTQINDPDTQSMIAGGKSIYKNFAAGMGIPRDVVNSVRKAGNSDTFRQTPEQMRKLEHIGSNTDLGYFDKYGDFYYY